MHRIRSRPASIVFGLATLWVLLTAGTTSALSSELNATPEDLYQRAEAHDTWMRERLMPAGGVMPALFTDGTFAQVRAYGSERDPAIWTGAYLAAQALRLMETGAADAAARVAETVQTLHRWWRISGDPGYLARFAAPADSPAAILATLPTGDPEVIRDVFYGGQLWHWRGRVSRDQYQGVLLGMSLAYAATSDETIRQVIRDDVVAFAEQLMRRDSKRVKVIINGSSNFAVTLDLEHVVYTNDETPDGTPILNVRTSPFEAEGSGMLLFSPNPSELARQIPGLGWLPDVLLPSQAIQLAAAFRVALQVTDGVPGYEARYAALRAHYEEHVETWLDIAAEWENSNDCGDSYHGLNIAFMPLSLWVWLEEDSIRRARLQRDVLRDALWSAVEDHKNVFFAFLYAALAAPEDAVDGVIDAHVAQLAMFPAAPQLARPLDVRWKYPEDPRCPGQSAIATDVEDRAGASFIWERQPWKLMDPGADNFAYPGVDYLLAYWLGRSTGLIEGDADLRVVRSGTGLGRVTSRPAGIDCGSDCLWGYPLGTSVTLGADPAPGYAFAGWSGACSGTANTCTLTIDGPKEVTASFVSEPSFFNISARARVRTGEGMLIGGFIIQGEVPKRVLIRARGPSLAAAGVSDAMVNPRLRLFSAGALIGANDNWRDGGQEADIIAAGGAPRHDAEAALIAELVPGPYTVHVEDALGISGVAIVEVVGIDEVPASSLVNLSARTMVGIGDDATIAGFVIRGTTAKRVLIRARGPSLVGLAPGVRLADPTLQLVADGITIANNDDWGTGADAAVIAATGRAPPDARESAILATLSPGAYTAIMRGKNGTGGIGIVEVIGIDEG